MFVGVECLDGRVQEKKNKQVGIWLEHDTAATVKKLSERSRLPMSEIIRLCVERQLAEKNNFKELARERKALQMSVRFGDSLLKVLNGIARDTDLPVAEIARLCLTQQLHKIRRQGLKLKITLDAPIER